MNIIGNNMKLASLNAIRRGEWLFKASVNQDEGVILVHAYNEVFLWSQIHFFHSENEAKNWVEYLVLQSKNLKENQ